ncbi:MAG TPA: MotA/TolQ/ExbB proton channel family protein [Kiritimatiellia bacterium]|nr:MotA/TolQ/ExbB proton channel family protein [Kiritimatiellia bacterium]
MTASWVPLLPLADFLYAFRESNFLSGKLIIIILFSFSIVAWTVMVSKIMELKRAHLAARQFLDHYRREQHPLGLFLRKQRIAYSPPAKVYESACMTVGVEFEARGVDEDLFRRGGENRIQLTAMQVGTVRNAAERQCNDQVLVLESKMGFLSTAVSASPLMGLLGTVWGVLDSFSQMAVQGSANLSAVAPGIASALLTTVVGLLVAIPSSIGYNMLASKIRQLTVQMDNFADEFVTELQRHYVRE